MAFEDLAGFCSGKQIVQGRGQITSRFQIARAKQEVPIRIPEFPGAGHRSLLHRARGIRIIDDQQLP